ncbi:DUF2190 family protein [Stakelama tenebrarum]|uniref:DUF2190 family protein n=1 Tax=Stakelama tenebrarum TaxID=2711215 RepID=A0A6G6Y4Z2_9SPHN|nr:DUF2190 family protein [Sphingosinithalassobacter tenebrarum]QIG79985.1 DUF2190 family protein [Sphingosinithalassobacter tenebrarum]
MKNFVQDGDAIDFVAPSGGVVSGLLYVIGGFLCVAATDAAEDETFSGWTEGVFEFTKETHATAQALDQGDPAYWDATEKRLTKTASGNVLVGAVTEDAASTATSAKVKLWPRGVAAGATIADISLAAVTGVDGTGSNAASKADVDTRMTTIQNKINAIIAAMESGGQITA